MAMSKSSPDRTSRESAALSGPVALQVRLRPLPVILTIATIAMMIGLGLHIVERFRAAHLHTYGEIADIYLNQFLEPYVLSQSGNDTVEAPHDGEIEAALAKHLKQHEAIVLQIWRTNGTLLYSSSDNTDASRHDNDELAVAIAGTSVSTIEDLENSGEGAPLPLPFLEIYVPIREGITDEVIAVGELYVDATEILQDMRFFERTVWWAIVVATLAVLVMLWVSSRQSEQLRSLLATQTQLASQNNRLRQVAEHAKLEASQSNEQTLNVVGAEIHDGPVQLLGLISLMGSGKAPEKLADGTTQSDLLGQAMTQLRRLSAGLILPELDQLGLREVIELTATRHWALTGAAVEIDYDVPDLTLDIPRRVCLYRVIQEGLTNATRHGGGGVSTLRVRGNASALNVTIHSRQATAPEASPPNPARQLGLQGMRRRLNAFNGTASLRHDGDSSVLQVTLPLAQDLPHVPDTMD